LTAFAIGPYLEVALSTRMLCYSFHSVKGGVGKSTLSILCAHALAKALEADAESPVPVVLIDMDLTGTSLADVLPLCAPEWPDLQRAEPIDLLGVRPSGAYHSPEETRLRMEARRNRLEVPSERPLDPRAPIGVPFLNDQLLFATKDWKLERDVPVDALLWREKEGPRNLWVIPSSALPDDLERILPVIYDEERAAFLEGRLERLFAALIARFGRLAVVIDTPPTVPGLSRSVLSLALRLGRGKKVALSEGGTLPPALEAAAVRWHACLVASPDFQDLRAAVRWLDLVRGDEQEIIRLAINRAPSLEPGDQQRLLTTAFAQSANALAMNPVWIDDRESFRLFRQEGVPLHFAAESPEDETIQVLLQSGHDWLKEGM